MARACVELLELSVRLARRGSDPAAGIFKACEGSLVSFRAWADEPDDGGQSAAYEGIARDEREKLSRGSQLLLLHSEALAPLRSRHVAAGIANC